MRVTIEFVHSIETAKNKSKQTLPGKIFLFLIRLHQLGERHAID